MNAQLSRWDIVKISAAFLLLYILMGATFGPRLVNAQATNVDAVADAMCNPVKTECMCGMFMDPQKGTCSIPGNKFMCPCQGPHTSGICDAPNHCKATSFNAQAGQPGGSPDMSKLMDALKGVMDALKGGGGGSPPPPPSGGGGGGSPQSPTGDQSGQPGSTACASYYPSPTQTSDPCAYYVPGTTDQTNSGPAVTTDTSQSLLGGLLGGSGSGSGNVSDQLLNQTSGSDTSGSSSGAGTNPVNLNAITSGSSNLGASGNIEVNAKGGTIYVSTNDPVKNKAAAAFFGGDVAGAAPPQGIIARLCTTRPWSKDVFAAIITPTFFDGLCAWRGYTVGTPAPAASAAPAVHKETVTPSSSTAQATSTAGPYITPQADIWAVPTTVPLDARTSIFWNTKGVVSCTVTSPDGSFNETALSGGASTVPLTEATTFSISCLAPDGSHVANYVTVNLSI